MKNYVLIGDVHSQSKLLEQAISYIDNNISDYFIIFLGDLFDSKNGNSNSVDVYSMVRELESNNKAVVLQSNHQDKLIRYLKGNNVSMSFGIDLSIRDFEESNVDKEELMAWLLSHPYGMVFRDSSGQEYRAAHAYFSSSLDIQEYSDEYYVRAVSKHHKSKFIYGLMRDNARIAWWEEYSNNDWIRVAGHYHVVYIDHSSNKSILVDSGSGEVDGKLSIYDINSRKLVQFE